MRARVGAIGLTLVVCAALAITLTPTPVDRGFGASVRQLLSLLHGWGVPASFGYAQLEFTANILMFVPLGFFAGLLARTPRGWLAVLLLPPLLSIGVESAQLLFLPERYATVADVMANCLGGWIGAGLARLSVRSNEEPSAGVEKNS